MATRAIKCVVVGDENGGDSEKECKNTKHKYYMNKHTTTKHEKCLFIDARQVIL